MDKPERQPLVVFTRYSPYTVVDVEVCTGPDGRQVALKPVTSLCRCGASRSKPFCDGSHSAVGFVGEKSPERVKDKVRDYVGREITIHDNRGVCAHDESCVHGSPSVFRPGARRWIDPDGADPEEIKETIAKCPSGALSCTCQGQRLPEPVREPAIRVVKGGPYQLVGGIRIKDDQGSRPQSAEHCTLCRCGASRNKPFCDGSHDEVRFDD